jgi:transcriptional regulator GlxA family with amidase domain
MTQLSLLLTHQHRLISIAAVLDVFESANTFYRNRQEPPFFKIQLVCLDAAEDSPAIYGYQPVSIHAVDKTDLILIPAFGAADIKQSIAANQAFIPWIKQQYEQGAEIGSFCTGAFLLAASGLLNNKKATTHIMSSQEFAAAFPEVKLFQDQVITIDNGIYTSGGATNSFHLLLFLLEKFCGRDMAVQTARMFSIDMDRESQSYFSTFLPPKNHQDDLIIEAQQLIENNYQRANTVEEIIMDMPSSRRNFVRRFKHATGITPIVYLQRTRIEAARKLLEQTNQSITEVMLNAGYNDIKAFRTLFRKNLGLSPRQYREKFNKRAPANKISA